MNRGFGRVRYVSKRGALVLCCEKYNEFSAFIRNKAARAGQFFFEDWLETIHMVRHVSAYRKHVALSCSTGGPLCSMVPRAKFFQHLVHKISKVEREEAYISFWKKTKTVYITNYNDVFADSQENMSLRKFMVWHKSLIFFHSATLLQMPNNCIWESTNKEEQIVM